MHQHASSTALWRAMHDAIWSCCSLAPTALEPKLIELNLEPLLEDPSSTLCCRLATFGQGSTAALTAGQFVVSQTLCA